MITWADCHIDWLGVDTIYRIVYCPDGYAASFDKEGNPLPGIVFIEPNIKDVGQREKLLKELNDAVVAGTKR